MDRGTSLDKHLAAGDAAESSVFIGEEVIHVCNSVGICCSVILQSGTGDSVLGQRNITVKGLFHLEVIFLFCLKGGSANDAYVFYISRLDVLIRCQRIWRRIYH